MCNWLSGRLGGVQVTPSNPADIAGLSAHAREAEQKIRALQRIAAEMGWHADSDLDTAWELIEEYDQRFGYTNA
jgi:hypothetical protein